MILLLPLFLSFILYILNEKNDIIVLYSIINIIIYNILISIGINIVCIYILIILIYWLINDNNKLYSLLFIISSILIFYSNSLYSLFISIELISLIMVTYINFYIQNKYYGILYYLFSSIFTGIFILSLGYIYLGYNLGYYLIILIFIYKLGLAPLHILIPKIYNNLSIKKLIFIDILCKYLNLFIFYRLFISISINLSYIILISIIISTLLTLKETNLLNILIYSSIINYSLILILINNFNIFFIYLIHYIFISLIFFYLITYYNLFYSINNSYYILLWFLLSMNLIGIPPFIGFWIKFYILYLLILSLNYYLLIIILFSFILLSLVYIRILLNFYINTQSIKFTIFNINTFNSHFISILINLLFFPILFIG